MISLPRTVLWQLSLVGVLVGGCADLQLDPDIACQQASRKLTDCGAFDVGSHLEGCTAEFAESVLEAQCQDMANVLSGHLANTSDFEVKGRRGKDDDLACRLGFMASCPDQICEDDEGLLPPTDEDSCIQWAQYSGCKACEYYRCREKQSQCGDDGYLLGYVGKYCDRFSTVTEPRLSEAGAAWMASVRLCLVDELEAQTDASDSCDTIAQVGTDSHAACYVNAGFCQLSVTDWFAIVHTIDAFDIPFQQMLATGNSCLREWFGPR